MNDQGISWKTQLRAASDMSIKDSRTFDNFMNKL